VLILSICQALFGAAAIICCAAAAWSVVRRRDEAGMQLMLAGGLSLAFFLTVPDVAVELLASAVLAIATGIILTPRHTAPAFELGGGDDLDVGDSTATRRLRRK